MEHPKIRLVLVDDHEMVRNTWKLILQQDIRIDIIAECSSGAEAIEIAAELLPDIMLMDINMSPVNGFEATRKILKHSPHTKIIGLSVHKQPSYAKNILQLGAKGYVTKSSPHKEIIQAILDVAEGKEYICSELDEHF